MGHSEWFRSQTFHGRVLYDEPLSKHTYFRIGGPADVMIEPLDENDLRTIWNGIRETGISFYFLGKGSNLLVSDKGYRGLIVKTTKLNPVIVEKEGVLELGGGVAITQLLREASQKGWGGLEFLSGVPGTVGGAVFMNAGTHLGESVSAVESVTTYDLAGEKFEKKKYEGSELNFSYRKNHFLKRSEIVYSSEWKVAASGPADVKARIDETLKRRKESQPIEFPSCGSVFKNPKPKRAWEVVDELGLRGHQIGQAQISEKHPNFILNHKGALASDVRKLIDLVKSRASSELGIEIHEEVQYLGFDN